VTASWASEERNIIKKVKKENCGKTKKKLTQPNNRGHKSERGQLERKRTGQAVGRENRRETLSISSDKRKERQTWKIKEYS